MACFIRGKINFKGKSNKHNMQIKSNINNKIIEENYSIRDENTNINHKLNQFEKEIFEDIKESNILHNHKNKMISNEAVVTKTKAEINLENCKKKMFENRIMTSLEDEKEKLKEKFIKILNKQNDFFDMKRVGNGK